MNPSIPRPKNQRLPPSQPLVAPNAGDGAAAALRRSLLARSREAGSLLVRVVQLLALRVLVVPAMVVASASSPLLAPASHLRLLEEGLQRSLDVVLRHDLLEVLAISPVWRTLDDLGAQTLVHLIHDTRVVKVDLQVLQSLESPVLQVAHLAGLVALPAPVLELVVEVKNVQRMVEVDEGVAHVGSVLVVNRYVDEVVLALEVLVNLLDQEIALVLVRDVADHYGRAQVISLLDLFQVDLELRLTHGMVSRCGVMVRGSGEPVASLSHGTQVAVPGVHQRVVALDERVRRLVMLLLVHEVRAEHAVERVVE